MRSRLALVLLSALLIVPGSTAQEPTLADEPQSIVVEQEVLPPGVAAPSEGIVCCPIAVTRHHVTLSAKRAYRCQPSMPVTLCVKNPVDCRMYAVEMCVPCCAVGEARLCDARCGLLGRGVVIYQWPCGLEAKIIFRARGDAVIAYRM